MTEQELKANINWSHNFNNIIIDGHAKKMGASCFLVYSTIKAHTNINNGKAFPSIERIGECSGFGKTTVMESLSVLEKMGYLKREKVGRKNEYTLTEIFQCRNMNNEIIAHASFDYIPAAIKETRLKLKNFLLTGENDNTIINVEYLTVNISNQGVQNIADNMKVTQNLTGDLKKSIDNLNKSRKQYLKESLKNV